MQIGKERTSEDWWRLWEDFTEGGIMFPDPEASYSEANT